MYGLRPPAGLGHHLLGGNDGIDEADLKSLLCGERLAREDDARSDRPRKLPRQALGAAPSGDETKGDFRGAQASTLGSDARIAGECRRRLLVIQRGV